MELPKIKRIEYRDTGKFYEPKEIKDSKFREIYSWLSNIGLVLNGSMRIYANEGDSARFLIPTTLPILVDYHCEVNRDTTRVATTVIIQASTREDLSALCSKLTEFGLERVGEER